MTAKDFFTIDQQKQIQAAIAEAEMNTSGEIRVHIDNSCKGDVLDVAADIFKNLKMHETALRNGVLIYLAVKDHKFAILGDKGINEKVPANFWSEVRDLMQAKFQQGQFTDGLSQGLQMAGQKLKEHYPRETHDSNELSDEVTYGN
jgi:uncharacterized membrane protein